MPNAYGRMPTRGNPLGIPQKVEGLITNKAQAIQIDDVNGDGTLMYIGEAVPGTATSSAGWQIRKVTKTGNITAITYVNGSSSFDYIWDNRASYSFS